ERAGRARRRRTGLVVGAAAVVAAVAIATVVMISVLAGPNGERAPGHPTGADDACTKDVGTGCAARCAAGDAEACFRDGYNAYYGREGRPVDLVAGIAQLSRGCELGHGPACLTVGIGLLRAAENGHRPPQEALSLAEKLLAHGCEIGYAQACRRLGIELLAGGKLPAAPDRGLDFLGKACAKDDSAGCIRLRDESRLDRGGASPAARERAAAVWGDACRRLPRLNCRR
ncbi:MAG: sel1 repeat family protein, partial [Deltaproteobacteria bacterium]|nr:sel1 repeat family protein [Deltaproteobacteria bacterium]